MNQHSPPRKQPDPGQMRLWSDDEFAEEEKAAAATSSEAVAGKEDAPAADQDLDFTDVVANALLGEKPAPAPKSDKPASAGGLYPPLNRDATSPKQGSVSSSPASGASASPSPKNQGDRDPAAAVRARLNQNRDSDRVYRRLPVPRPEQLAPAPVQAEQLPATFAPSAAYADPDRDAGKIDLRKYLWLLFRHRWLILGAAGLCLAVGLVNTLLTTPIYRATTTIQINREAAKIVQQGDDLQQVDDGRDAEFYGTQYQLLRSRSLAERVVKTLALQDDAAFMATSAPSSWSNLKRIIFGAPPSSGLSASGEVEARQAAAAGRIMGGFSIQPVNNSTIVALSFDSPNPAVATKVVNGIAASFISDSLDRRYAASTYARQFLEDRLQQLKVKLEDSEKALVAYADQNHILNAGNGVSLDQANLAAANEALTKATNDRLSNELLLKQIKSPDGLGMPQVLADKTIQDLRTKRNDLVSAYKDKLNQFKPAYPEMVAIQKNIAEIDQQIAAGVNLIAQSIEAAYEAAKSEENAQKERIEQLKGDLTDFNNRNIQYTILQREVDTNRSLYDGLLQRYKEIGVAGAVGTNNVSVVDEAQVPGAPFSPNLKKNLMMSLLLGLLLGAGAAFAREQLDDTFKSPDDVEENLRVPLLGVIPLARSAEEHNQALSEPRSAIAEAYRSLRTALQFSTGAGVPKTLLVTSSRASEGKSTTALTLAQNYAQLGMNVLLIDADLRKPTLDQLLGVDGSVGLTNCLTSPAFPREVFQKTSLPKLTFMPSGPLPPNPAELLAGPKMLTLMTVAAEQYDLVIIDGPPVAGLADAPLLASMAEGTLFVIDGSRTRKKTAEAALKRLYLARAQVAGAVINKLDATAPGYGYGYGYGHGYGDSDYYGAERAKEIVDARSESSA